MKIKIIKAFLEWCKEYNIEDYEIHSYSYDKDVSKIHFYIYESEIPLEVDILDKSINFVFGKDDICDERFLDDQVVLELANLCSKIRNVLTFES